VTVPLNTEAELFTPASRGEVSGKSPLIKGEDDDDDDDDDNNNNNNKLLHGAESSL
jgi:hypothetical protein